VHIQHVPFGEVATSMCTARLPVSRSAPAPADGGARAPGGGPPEPERGTAEYILVASYRVADGKVDGGLLTVMQIRPEPAARRRGRALAPAPAASVPPRALAAMRRSRTLVSVLGQAPPRLCEEFSAHETSSIAPPAAHPRCSDLLALA